MDSHIDLVNALLNTGLTQQALGNLLGKSQAWVTAVRAGKYSDIKWADGEALRKLHAERCAAPQPRALACATQSVRLTADRRDLVRRAEPVEAPQPNQLPLALAAGERYWEAE